MNDEISTLGEAFVANIAPKWPLPGVNAFVLFQITLLRKSLAAELTAKRFLSIVRKAVNVQRSLFNVILSTTRKCAPEQLPLGMMLHVLGQGRGPLETFSTDRTQIWLSHYVSQLSGVLSVVLGQVGTLGKAHAADFAHVRFVDEVSTRVASQFAGVRKFLLTNTAFKMSANRWIVVVCLRSF